MNDSARRTGSWIHCLRATSYTLMENVKGEFAIGELRQLDPREDRLN